MPKKKKKRYTAKTRGRIMVIFVFFGAIIVTLGYTILFNLKQINDLEIEKKKLKKEKIELKDDNWDEKIFQKLQISAVILQPNYNLILLNADIATLKQPPRQDPHQHLCPAHRPLCRTQHFFPRVPHTEATGRLWQHEEHWLQESSLCSGGGLDGRLVAV